MRYWLMITFYIFCAVGITVPTTSLADNEPANFSLHFKEISVRELLTLLAQIKNKNLVLSDAVQGRLTLHLENITWQQALDTVLDMQGLGMRQEGGILLIAPTAEILDRKAQLMAVEAVKAEFFPVHYAKAADLSKLLQKGSDGLLSQRGSVTVDERTNQLWVKDTPDRLKQIRAFLKGVDLPAKQVQITARIVNIDESSIEELGLKFGTVTTQPTALVTSNQLHMDMPVVADNVGHFTMAIAKLGESTLLNLELSALEKTGRARVVSNPQLVTADRQAATIESGQEVPYQEKTSSGATNTAFKKAVLRLKVTPEITPENKILLNLMVNQDKVDTLTVNGVPAISTQQVQSQVLLNNGETIVLGGIYEQSNNKIVERIPFWGSIPILGKLFSNQEIHTERKELLVFVTPQMIE